MLSEEDVESIVGSLLERLPETHVCKWQLSPEAGVAIKQLSPEDVSAIKRGIRLWNLAVTVVGTIIVGSMVTGLLAFLSKGFWAALWEGAKASAK